MKYLVDALRVVALAGGKTLLARRGTVAVKIHNLGVRLIVRRARVEGERRGSGFAQS